MNSSTAHYAGRYVSKVCRKRNCRGFTLIELMIVITIVGILAAIAVPNYQWSVIKAREAVLRETLYNFNNCIDQYYADQGEWPKSLDDLKQKQYLRDIPKDPFTGNNSEWVYIASTGGGSSSGSSSGGGGGSSAGGSIPEVKSGSKLVSPSTNTPYSEW